MKTLVLIRGYPGSGKTTVGKALQEEGVGRFIDHNAILTFIASIVGNDEGIYEEIHVLEKSMTKKLLAQGDTAIVARGFSNSQRISEYYLIAKELNARFYAFTLKADINILEHRVQAPERRSDFNPTTTPNALLRWVDGNPLEKYEGEIILDASEQVEVIVKKIKQLLDL